MRIRDNPSLVLTIVVIAFIAALALSLYLPSYGTATSHDSRSLEIVRVTYIQYHFSTNNQNATTTTITQSWVCSPPVPCTYHTQ
ncbi:MAG: hypothetical protein JRN20_15010 [Nitrososphaerota archaeon]|nr:hypothetical protein [Nitrososphaerota archaeon]